MLAVLIIAATTGIKSFLIKRKQEGTYYYTKVTPLSESRVDSDYLYRVDGFEKNGKVIRLEFYGMNEKPIKKNAYLKVTYGTVSDCSQGVKRWEEIKKSEIPEKALEKLEKN